MERLEAQALLVVQGNIGRSSNKGRITITGNSTSGYVLKKIRSGVSKRYLYTAMFIVCSLSC